MNKPTKLQVTKTKTIEEKFDPITDKNWKLNKINLINVLESLSKDWLYNYKIGQVFDLGAGWNFTVVEDFVGEPVLDSYGERSSEEATLCHVIISIKEPLFNTESFWKISGDESSYEGKMFDFESLIEVEPKEEKVITWKSI